MLKNEIKKVSK